jgi:hypothetical protein
MPNIFNLWNPYLTPEDTCELDVTMAEAFYLQDASREWVQGALSKFGIQAGLPSYSIDRVRCAYYSSDPDRFAAWRDRWVLCWLVRVEGPVTPCAYQNRLFDIPEALDQSDRTEGDDYDEGVHNQAVLLAFDYAEERTRVEANANLVKSAAGEMLPSTSSEVVIRSYAEELHQVRLRLGGVKMPNDIQQLDALAERIRHTGAAANVRERHSWPERPKSPEGSDQEKLTQEIGAWKDMVLGLGRGGSEKK